MAPFRRWPLPRRMVLAALAGAFAATGLAPLGAWPATLIGFATLPALLLPCGTARQAAWTGWAFGTGYFLLALVWIVEPFLVDVARHGWMAPFALFGLSAGLALFWGLATALAHRIGRPARARGLTLALALAGVEAARGYVLTGFPWAAPAQVWVGTPVAGLLAWIGPQGLTLVTLLAACVPGAALARGARTRNALLALLPALALLVFAQWSGRSQPEVFASGQTVRLVQPNAPQHLKWHPAHMRGFFERQLAFTRAEAEAEGQAPDLVVWPETAVPALLNRPGTVLDEMAAAADGTPLVFGIQREDADGLRFYNALVLLDETGQPAQLYDKYHLVPFGEYVPFGNLAARFGLSGFAAQQGNGYSAGPGPRLIDLGPLGKALPLICYEAVFPQDVTRAPERPDLLLQITNDAWFGAHIGPYQHLAQARMRAIEQGLPMIRVANTGVSAMIDPLGRIVAALPMGEAGFLDAPLPLPLPPTAYARMGDGPLMWLMVAGLLGLWATRRLRRPIRG